MEDPKTVVKTEPRKSLIVLLALGIYMIITGSVILIGLGSGDTQMAEGAGYILVIVGVGSIISFILARRQTLREKEKGEKREA